ncbi:enhanced intracellular survival protein Eis [Paenibacillus sp. NPDC058071]|uniref:GNAT family N-acetyltransferase n=1 Tax=Paenibacillus sp. NPDC058071 TaxID=3346326 RepID=UPI0036DE0771
MTLDIRTFGTELLDESLELSKFAFQVQITPEEEERMRERIKKESATQLGAFIEGQLAAKLTKLNLQVYLGGKSFEMGGIAGVSTWPEYRRQGLVAKLLSRILEEMRDSGQTVSMLAPFAIGFYRKFGWELYTDRKEYEIEAAKLPPRTPYQGTIKRTSDYDLLNTIYNEYAQNYNGTLTRSAVWWEQRIQSRFPGSQSAVYYDTEGRACGYVRYKVASRELALSEFVYTTEEARSALWSFLGQHDSMIDRLKASLPIDDALPYLLPDPRIKQTIYPYFMARIVDLESFLKQYPFNKGEQSLAVQLDIADEHAPWNSGRYSLKVGANGTAEVVKLPQAETASAGAEYVRTSIGQLSAILFNYKSTEELRRHGLLQCNSETAAELDKRIPKLTPFLADFF